MDLAFMTGRLTYEFNPVSSTFVLDASSLGFREKGGPKMDHLALLPPTQTLDQRKNVRSRESWRPLNLRRGGRKEEKEAKSSFP